MVQDHQYAPYFPTSGPLALRERSQRCMRAKHALYAPAAFEIPRWENKGHIFWSRLQQKIRIRGENEYIIYRKEFILVWGFIVKGSSGFFITIRDFKRILVPIFVDLLIFQWFGRKDLREVSTNTQVSDMRVWHVDTSVRLLERERSRKANFSVKLRNEKTSTNMVHFLFEISPKM